MIRHASHCLVRAAFQVACPSSSLAREGGSVASRKPVAAQDAQTFGSRFGVDERAQSWERLGSEQFDVVVVGGGVVGVGTALDAATRGLRVALVEARDLASGTSSRSSKLFHGGLRYLEQLEFGLVREALRERELMLTRIAPHLVKPVSFPLPAQAPVLGAALHRVGSGALRPHGRRAFRARAEASDQGRRAADVPGAQAQRVDRRRPVLRRAGRRRPAHAHRGPHCRALRRGGAHVHAGDRVPQGGRPGLRGARARCRERQRDRGAGRGRRQLHRGLDRRPTAPLRQPGPVPGARQQGRAHRGAQGPDRRRVRA